jgi:hypothetical protein
MAACNNSSKNTGKMSLTPKGLGLPYVGFSDYGQGDVNAIIFWIF